MINYTSYYPINNIVKSISNLDRIHISCQGEQDKTLIKLANIFANELFTTINNKAVLSSTT